MEYELITYFSTNLTMDEILDRWSQGTAAEKAIAEMIDKYAEEVSSAMRWELEE